MSTRLVRGLDMMAEMVGIVLSGRAKKRSQRRTAIEIVQNQMCGLGQMATARGRRGSVDLVSTRFVRDKRANGW